LISWYISLLSLSIFFFSLSLLWTERGERASEHGGGERERERERGEAAFTPLGRANQLYQSIN
jgi:hypothetical protein